MSFNTTSYLAGVGTVVAALTIGFSGGFFLAPTTDHVEQNRLQRVASSAPISNPASQEAITPKPEITQARSIELVAAKVPAPSTQQPAGPETVPVMAKAVEPTRASREENAARPEVNTERMRRADAKAERKRAREQRRAERRKQRETEFAAVAVNQMARDRDPQQVADRTESPRLGLFGEN
jgi:type IV secretory pathway VirB10-like protein